ncbi:MAG: type II toxin-antitoxin system HicA family toxin [Chloroflexi bacterium]|nr:type II toxin-antitoxin system HicA family toxin [Chloroflexota bacterium]
MTNGLPAITGKQLIRLFRLDGWVEGGRRTHGVFFSKPGPDGHLRITIIPDKRSPLPAGTLAAILGPKQSDIGRDGLGEMIRRHGLK